MTIPKLSLEDTHDITGIPIFKQHSVAETYPMHTYNFYELFL